MLLRKRGFAEARPLGIASICSMYIHKQRTNVNEVFGWLGCCRAALAHAGPARPPRPTPPGWHERRCLCLLSETEFSVPEANIIQTNRLQTRSRDASASLAFHTQ
eukprot:5896667-Prymnesium_polylepis.1